MNTIKAVIDTNVIISGILGGGTSRSIMKAFQRREYHLYFSEELMKEIEVVTNRPHLRKILDADRVNEFMDILKNTGIEVKPRIKIDICRDIKDNFLLECAVESKCDVLVSWDPDLLELKEYASIQILSPPDFLKKLPKI